MQDRKVNQWIGAAVAAALIAITQVVSGPGAGHATPTPASTTHHISAAETAATFTYDGSVTPGHKALIARAIARARPEAQRLFAIIDGLTEIRVGLVPGGNLGVAEPQPDGTYILTLDLATTFQTLGERGVTRLVVHELGHVVDFALISPELARDFNAGIPPGLPCPPGTHLGSCAPERERFAETFAKWAMNDLGLDLYIGYAVPAPYDLEAWAAPLLSLDT